MNQPPPANTRPPASGGSKPLWAAALVLTVVVLSMGAALIHIQNQPVEPRMAVLPEPAPAASDTPHDGATGTNRPGTPDATDVAAGAAGAAMATSAVPAGSGVIEKNWPPTLSNQAQTAINSGSNQAIEISAKPRPVLPRQAEPAVLRPPAPGAPHTTTPDPLQPLPR